jgi:membrane fusion protein (multidrug efflux system)
MFLTRATAPDLATGRFEAEVAGSSDFQLPSRKPINLRKIFVYTAVLTALAATAVFGYQFWQHAATHEETDDAYTTGHLHQIAARIDGTVAKVLVEDNQLVQAGDLLVQLDPNDFEVKVQAALAALETARHQSAAAQTAISLSSRSATAQSTSAEGNLSNSAATISRAKAAVLEARSAVPIALTKVGQADADLKKAEADYLRYDVLEKQGAVSKQQLDAATRDFQVAQKAREAAEQEVSRAQAQLAQADEGVRIAESQLTQSHGMMQQAQAATVQTEVSKHQFNVSSAAILQAKAALKEAQLNLSYTNITAPTSGRVGKKSVEVGQRIQPGQPLLIIVSEKTWVVANFKETQVERMHRGQPVEIKVDSLPHHKFSGLVDSFAPGSGASFALLPSDNATGNFTKIVQRIPVKILFNQESTREFQGRLVPGMSTVVSVKIN